MNATVANDCHVMKNERIYWIDIAKSIAMIGVLIDHTQGHLYVDTNIAYLSYFSVSLFVIVMGFNSYYSILRWESNDISIWLKNKLICIVFPYFVATIIYSLFIDRAFVFESIIDRAIHFNACGPLYYIALYIQLIACSPILFRMIEIASKKNYSYIIYIIVFVILIIIASFTTRFSNILDVYGGGGKLLGGTYIVLFYLGMLMAKQYGHIVISITQINRIILVLSLLFGIILTIAWWRFISFDKLSIDKKIPFGDGFNPPSLSFCLYALLVLFVLLNFSWLFQGNVLIHLKIILAFIGKHSLYIFMYHRLFMLYILEAFLDKNEINFNMGAIKTIMYFTFMIGGSLVMELLIKKTVYKCKNCYFKYNEQQ